MAGVVVSDQGHVAAHNNRGLDITLPPYGAVGDGVTDDASAIGAAITAAEALSPTGTVYFPPKQYKIDSGITVLDCDIDAAPGAQLLVDAAVSVGLTIGSSSQSCDRHTLRLPQVKIETQQWTKDSIGSDRGVVFAAADSCIVQIPNIQDFSYGLVLEGDGQGVAYNTFTISGLDDNAINCYLSSINSGWANQNTFIGGRWSVGQNGAASRIAGTRQLQLGENLDIAPPDNNTFIGCSFEGDWEEYMLECWGVKNIFLNCRWESTDDDGAVIFRDFDASRYANGNLIIGGVDVETLTITQETHARYNAVWSPVRWEFEASGADGIAMFANRNSNDKGIRFFEAPVFGKTSDDDYKADLGANYFRLKAAADTYDRVLINNALGRIYLGAGNSDPTSNGFFRWSNSGFNFSAPISLSDGPRISTGTATPEGAVTAGIGSLFLRSDGGANTTLYVKESGAGNTGWVAK